MVARLTWVRGVTVRGVVSGDGETRRQKRQPDVHTPRRIDVAQHSAVPVLLVLPIGKIQDGRIARGEERRKERRCLRVPALAGFWRIDANDAYRADAGFDRVTVDDRFDCDLRARTLSG